MTSIKNENDYQRALETLELVFNAKKASPEGVHLEMLSRLVDQYENKHFPIGMPDHTEAIKFRMEQMGTK